MKYIFFSLRDFKKDVGESVRMYGLLNSLASQGKEVIFISNARRSDSFHPSIQHIQIGCDFKGKRSLQGLLSLLPAKLVYYLYQRLFKKIKIALSVAHIGSGPVYFFDYLDNSIGYILKKSGLINSYINDIHGIVTIEFLNNVKNSKSVRGKTINRIKHYLAHKLDRKVFGNADGFIYGSANMKAYYERLYNIKDKKSYVIPYVLGEDAVNRTVNEQLKKSLQDELKLKPEHFVVFFVGTYKQTGGVDDLINAFKLLFKEYKSCKLVLVGNGPYKEFCVQLADQPGLKSNIIFIDNIPYADLATYQSLANVIVCPDKENPFSQYVIHVKYFDALISGKLVINGAFKSVKEVNKGDSLSLSFEPSNVMDLYQKLKFCKENYNELMKKYNGSKDYAAQQLTYTSYLKDLTEDMHKGK